MDDMLIWGATQREHDERLLRALSQLQQAGFMLSDKCELSKSRITFLRQSIEASSVSEDPDKGSGARSMKEPKNISEVRSFLGMANHPGKFLHNLAEKMHPLAFASIWTCQEMFAH